MYFSLLSGGFGFLGSPLGLEGYLGNKSLPSVITASAEGDGLGPAVVTGRTPTVLRGGLGGMSWWHWWRVLSRAMS